MSEIKPIEPMYCDCETHYGPDGIYGDTKMNYQGKGVWKCPKCQNTVDHSPVIYKMRLEIKKDNEDHSWIHVNIIEPITDARLLEKGNGYTLQEVIQDSIDEGVDGLQDHEEGIFDVELRYNSFFDSEAGDGDIDIGIVSEQKVSFVTEPTIKER